MYELSFDRWSLLERSLCGVVLYLLKVYGRLSRCLSWGMGCIKCTGVGGVYVSLVLFLLWFFSFFLFVPSVCSLLNSGVVGWSGVGGLPIMI